MKQNKVLFHQGNAPSHKSLITMAKLHELGYELLPHRQYSPDLAPNDYWLIANLKKMIQGKRFVSNDEVIAETNAYFGAKNKSFYTPEIEIWKSLETNVSHLKETKTMKKVRFCQKNFVLLVSPGTY